MVAFGFVLALAGKGKLEALTALATVRCRNCCKGETDVVATVNRERNLACAGSGATTATDTLFVVIRASRFAVSAALLCRACATGVVLPGTARFATVPIAACKAGTACATLSLDGRATRCDNFFAAGRYRLDARRGFCLLAGAGLCLLTRRGLGLLGAGRFLLLLAAGRLGGASAAGLGHGKLEFVILAFDLEEFAHFADFKVFGNGDRLDGVGAVAVAGFEEVGVPGEARRFVGKTAELDFAGRCLLGNRLGQATGNGNLSVGNGGLSSRRGACDLLFFRGGALVVGCGFAAGSRRYGAAGRNRRSHVCRRSRGFDRCGRRRRQGHGGCCAGNDSEVIQGDVVQDDGRTVGGNHVAGRIVFIGKYECRDRISLEVRHDTCGVDEVGLVGIDEPAGIVCRHGTWIVFRRLISVGIEVADDVSSIIGAVHECQNGSQDQCGLQELVFHKCPQIKLMRLSFESPSNSIRGKR